MLTGVEDFQPNDKRKVLMTLMNLIIVLTGIECLLWLLFSFKHFTFVLQHTLLYVLYLVWYYI